MREKEAPGQGGHPGAGAEREACGEAASTFNANGTPTARAEQVNDAERGSASDPQCGAKAAVEGEAAAGVIAAHDDGRVLLESRSPERAACAFVEHRMPHVRVWQSDIYDWRAGGAYQIRSDAFMRSQVRKFLANAKVAVYENIGRKMVNGKLKVADYAWFDPKVKDVTEVLQSVIDHRHLPEHEFAPPCWLPDNKTPRVFDRELPAEHVLAFPNCVLDLRSGMTLKPTPNLFTTAACGFDYEEDPPPPAQWLTFLDDIFAGEQEQVDLLQEWFGYCLSPDCSLDKAMVLVGPARSGKGTVMQMLRELLSPSSVVGPTLAQMQTNFGMSALIGKRLAIVDDVRVGRGTDMNAVTENILNLTGRKWWTLDRKFKAAWSGYLPCKLAVVSNEMPAWRDDSGVIATRLLTLRTRASFLGKEEPLLFRDYLQPERASVLKWALAGERRVRENGCFSESRVSQEECARNEAAAAPHLIFVREKLIIDQNAEVEKDDLFKVYEAWCRETGAYASNKDWLVRNLNKVLPRPLVERKDKGERYLRGVRLKNAQELGDDSDLVDRAQAAEEDIPF